MPRRDDTPKRERLTEARKAAFLEALRIHGVATRAAREASPRAKGKSVIATFRDERKRNADFAQAWDDALEAHHGDLLAELYRRAMTGDQVPIQNAKGEVIGWRSLRSDKLLLEAVRAHHAFFTPRTQTEATVEQTVTKKRGGTPDHLAVLDTLSRESQDDLRRIIEREKALRAAKQGGGAEPTRNGRAPSPALPLTDERTR